MYNYFYFWFKTNCDICRTYVSLRAAHTYVSYAESHDSKKERGLPNGNPALKTLTRMAKVVL
jgi:hypothetical protein